MLVEKALTVRTIIICFGYSLLAYLYVIEGYVNSPTREREAPRYAFRAEVVQSNMRKLVLLLLLLLFAATLAGCVDDTSEAPDSSGDTVDGVTEQDNGVGATTDDDESEPSGQETTNGRGTGETVTVTRVVDGDTFDISAGCDKRAATCKAKFANFLNFRGAPHMPGNDVLVRHPARETRRDGGAR